MNPPGFMALNALCGSVRECVCMCDGGQGGIRTHGTLAGTPHFECGAIDHSTTCPRAGI
jgi:hypothetical protein